jgi:hypothetical protein
MPNTPECIRHEGIPLDHCPSACFRITTVVRDRDSSRSVLASAPISFVLPSCPLEMSVESQVVVPQGFGAFFVSGR